MPRRKKDGSWKNSVDALSEALIIVTEALRSAEGTPGGAGDFLTPPKGKMPPNDDADWLSPEEQAILAVVPEEGWRTAKAIARDLKTFEDAEKQGVPGELYTLLRNLVGRKVLDSSREGYRRHVTGRWD